ncbi:transposase [Fusarium mundagurra]|uniref:Transposase n=1 Tax=Fusarium mundagurra TaxID=1567541 RepID=A0A8H5Y735_9HYPO|nr:transposase [Fusarium mundagurra]
MPPIKADAAFVWRQFIDLGRSNCKKSKRYRCRHCQKEFAATSVGRPKEHLAACDKWQARQRQERQARDNAGYLPSYSEAIQKKITEVGIQHISQDESRSFAYDAAAAVIAGGRPFSLFESRRWRYFFTRIKPGWKPPSRAVITRILPEFYQEIYDEVFKRITSSEWFNIIFDASDNVSGHRIVNISVQVPDGPAFYWKTLDTGDERHTAENWVRLIWGEMQQLCGGDLSRINSICTDTENTMRSVHDLLGGFPELSHINFSLCDSHGLQLLIKDILFLPFFEDLFNNVSTLLVFFSRSKLQLQRLRMCQRTRWNGVTRALIRSIITRWGSQYNSFFSLLRSRDPARDWSVRKDVRDELRSQDCPVLLPEAVRIIKDSSFWLELEAAIAVLKPVNDFQHVSEADGAGIAHVVNRWLQIKSKWAEMREADQFPDIPWDDIDAIFKARLDKQTYDIHWIADALRPDTTGPNSKLPPSVFARVQEYLQKQLENDDEYHRALSEFTHFRMRTGGPDGLFNKHSAVYDDGFRPAMAWQCLLNQGSTLARVAMKVINTLANSVPSERSFSAISFIHTKARNRLTPMHADMQAFIFMNDRVLDRLKDQKYAHKKRWADLEEKDWLELEDSYLELFVNAQGKKVWMDGVMASANGDFEWEGVLQSIGDILGECMNARTQLFPKKEGGTLYGTVFTYVLNLAVQAFLFIDSKEAARAALEHIEDTDESAFGTDFSERIKPQRAQGWRRLGPLGKVHNISIHMRENDYRWNEFKKRAGRSLGLDNDTRWNSWFLLLDTTLNLQSYVEWYQKKYYQDLRDDYLTPDEWSALGETRAFLQPFWKITQLTEGRYATLDRNTLATPHYGAALQLLGLYSITHIKKNWPKSWYKPVLDGVRKHWKDYYHELPLPTTTPQLRDEIRRLDEYDLLARELDVVSPSMSELDEYDAFTTQPPIVIDCSPLSWWLREEQQQTYPRLSRMAVDILSIPAMSAEPEPYMAI